MTTRKRPVVLLGLAAATVVAAVGLWAQLSPTPQTPPTPVLVGAALPSRQPPAVGPTEVAVPVGVDGCDRNYASVDPKRDICVPLRAPGDRPVDCTYLVELGLGTLVVVGTDDKSLGGQGGAPPGTQICG